MKHLLALTLMAALSGVAVADETEDQIAKYDKDDDGKLTRIEIADNQEISAQFEALDVNGDDMLDEDELDSGPFDDFDEMGEDPIDETN